MYKIVRRLGLFLTLAGTLAALSGSMASTAIPALADGDSPPQNGSHADKVKDLMKRMRESVNETLPANAPLVPWPDDHEGSGGTAATSFSTQFDPNPYGCIGQTDNPHKSTHTGGTTINVIARTKCNVSVPEIYVNTQLYKRDCGWPWCGWSPYAPDNPKTDYNKSLLQTNSASGPCVNGEYKGTSSHYIIGADGNFYSAITQNAENVTTC